MNTTLVNAVPCDLRFSDGRTVTVEIQKLELEPLYKWCKFVAEKNSPALVRLCTGKPAEFFRHVEPKSFAILAKACIELNFPQALDLIEDPTVAASLAPLLQEMAVIATRAEDDQVATAWQRLKQKGNTGTTSPDSSPSPAPSASATEIGTPSSADLPSNGSSPS